MEEVKCDKCKRQIVGEMLVSEELGEIIISHVDCRRGTFNIFRNIRLYYNRGVRVGH